MERKDSCAQEAVANAMAQAYQMPVDPITGEKIRVHKRQLPTLACVLVTVEGIAVKFTIDEREGHP